MPTFFDYDVLTAPSAADVLAIVDVSDPSMSPEGSTKQITVQSLVGGIFPVQPSGDTTGAADYAAIQGLINLGAKYISLGIGLFYINKPLVIQSNGVHLAGSGGATASGNDASLDLGTTIKVTATFSNTNTWSGLVNAAIVVLQKNAGTGSGGADPGTNQVSGTRIKDLWIDGSASPSAVDGVACFGAIEAFQMERVGCYAVTGKAFPQYKDSTFGSANFPDGQHLYSCLAQQCHDHAFYGSYVDARLSDCHAQSSNLSGVGYGDGFYFTGNNNRLMNCRSDLNSHGFTFDAPSVLNSGQNYNDSNIMVGCGTQGNNSHGLNVINSSAAGNATRVPLIVSGCSFDGDGQNGGSGSSGAAGIFVSGRNVVSIDNTNVLVATQWAAGGSPDYGILTATSGTGPTPPMSVRIASGHLNGLVAGFSDAAVSQDFNVGAMVTTSAGVEGPTSGTLTQPNAAKLFGALLNLAAASGNARGSLAQFTQTTSAPSNPGVNFTGVNATDPAAGSIVSGDTNGRWRLDINGRMSWGSGSATPDTQITRGGAGILQMNDGGAGNSIQLQLNASASQSSTTPPLLIQPHNSGDVAAGFQLSGDSSTRLRIDSGGVHKWGSGSATQDVALQRGAAGRLDLSTDQSAGTFKSLDPYAGGFGFFGPTGQLGMTNVPRGTYNSPTSSAMTGNSGTVFLVAYYLPAGTPVTNISFLTGTGTLKTGGSHGWYVLCDSSRKVQAASTDQTDASTTWGVASTVYSLAVSPQGGGQFVTTYSGLWYLGIMIVATQMPFMVAGPNLASGVPSTVGTALCGTSSTGQTTPPTANGTVTLTAISGVTAANFFCWVT